MNDTQKDQVFVLPQLLGKTITSLHRVQVQSIEYEDVIVLLCSDGKAWSLVSTQGGLECSPVESMERIPMSFTLEEGETTQLLEMEVPEVYFPLHVTSIRASFCHFDEGDFFPFNFSLREDRGKALFFDCEGDELHLMTFEGTVGMLQRISQNHVGEIRTMLYTSTRGIEVG